MSGTSSGVTFLSLAINFNGKNGQCLYVSYLSPSLHIKQFDFVQFLFANSAAASLFIILSPCILIFRGSTVYLVPLYSTVKKSPYRFCSFPVIFTFVAYNMLYKSLGGVFFTEMFPLQPLMPFGGYVCLALVGCGMAVGLIGSFFSGNKYLRGKR